MSNKVINEQIMTDIADAIREKLETSDKFHPSEMPGAIHRIKGGIAEWERPSEWPNLDSLDLSDYEDVFVITLDNTKKDAWFSVKASTSAGSGTIILFEQGTVIDGEFVLEQKSLLLPFRGSENQRLIDVPATLKSGSVTEYILKNPR